MRMTQGWTRLRTAVVALGLIAWTTTGAKADAISNLLDYSTAGSVDYHDRGHRRECDQLHPGHERLDRPDLEPSAGFVPGRCPADRPVDDVQQHAVQHHLRRRPRTTTSP